MYYIIDNKQKVIFGWSAKCGCTHIKRICYYLQNNVDNIPIHINITVNRIPLPYDIENYITILIIRNPYERLVSGFLDKYSLGGEFRSLWKDKKLTFNNFINELIKIEWKMIEHHHFTLQTSEFFDKELLLKSKLLHIYDLKNINYKYIEYLYNKKIPEHLLNFKGPHARIQTKVLSDNERKNIQEHEIDFYHDYNIPFTLFYNDDIKNKVYKFYLNDFLFFKEFGFNYINTV